MNTHRCPTCGIEKEITNDFFRQVKRSNGSYRWQLFSCRKCLNNKYRERARLSMAKCRSTEEGKRRHDENARKYRNTDKGKLTRRLACLRYERRKNGSAAPYVSMETKRKLGKEREEERAERSRQIKEARAAWQWWLREGAPDSWMNAYYKAKGDPPWRNIRLSEAEKYTLQYKLDPEFNLKERIRNQLNKKKNGSKIIDLMRIAIKNEGESKTVYNALGYSIADLKDHLERQFTRGMTWDKFMKGEIHIDHIIPKSTFNINNEDEFKICYGLPNLRPLWAKDNMSKRDKKMFLL